MSFFDVIYSQLILTLPKPEEDQSGKTFIVTGSNVGLGLEAARHLVRINASKVILAVRNREKGEQAKQSIEKSTGRTGVVEVWDLDLGSYQSVKQFADRASSLPRLDALLANAGVASYNYSVLEADEATITVNVVSTFLLSFLLLPKLKESARKFNIRPRLTIISSAVHTWTQFKEWTSGDIFATLNDKSTANMKERYPVSKLLEVLVCRQLAAEHPQPGFPIIVNFVNPGLCHSELARDGGWGIYFLKLLFARTTEAGSRTLVHGVLAGPETHGMYLSDCRVSDPSPFVRSKEGGQAQRKVWEQLSRKLERIQPGIMSNI